MISLFDEIDERIVIEKPIRKIASIPRYKDDIANFFEDQREAFLEAMFLSEISKPNAIGTLKYRMQAPDFFNATVTEFFNQEVLKIAEHEGKSYDWELLNKKISVKSMHTEIFPRPYKRGNGITQGQPIQLKNTKESIILKNDEFDYLLVTVACDSALGYGLYLFGHNQVKQLLKSSCQYNKNCDENGYDGKGQIKLYVHNKADCLAAVEMNNELLASLKNRYNCNISASKRDSKWLTNMNNCIKTQIYLSRGKND